MIFLIVSLILIAIVVRLIVRIAFSALWFGGYGRRLWGRRFGCGYGCGRPSFGGMLPLLGLLALGRLFGRRW
jgi:hypothetical protein